MPALSITWLLVRPVLTDCVNLAKVLTWIVTLTVAVLLTWIDVT